MDRTFHYDTAFSRNIGWVTETEQEILRNKRIAIAGMGGVGGSHLITLTRLGVGKFNISDLDIFELANFNRQAGASLSHIDRPKVEVMAELARDINAELELKIFPEGVNKQNLDEFLEDVDLYVDGLDFFALEARKAVFAACAEKGIPAVTAAPLGMGVALLSFLPGKMSFEEYFRLNGQTEDEQLLRFLLGLSPAMLQMSYLVDDSRVELDKHKGPSTPMACELCAGLAATNALKVLLQRGKVFAAPRGLHFDAFRNKFSQTWRPWGNNNWIQRLGIEIARKKLSEKQVSAQSVMEEPIADTPLNRILELARWAPSGDNTQPWRFEVIDEQNFSIHCHDTREWCVYDLDGRASQIAIGALLETITIVAQKEGFDVAFERDNNSTEEKPTFFATLSANSENKQHPLHAYVKQRTTQRRAMSSRQLSQDEKQQLSTSIGDNYRLIWIEGYEKKRQIARLLSKSANIRLTIPEAYKVHSRIIEWGARFSVDRIPDQAVGLDPLSLKLMHWVMASWKRVKFFNAWLLGTVLPRIELDIYPALKCGAHFIIVANKPLETMDDYLDGGKTVQRFWLTVTRAGLQFQPAMTPLIFSRYKLNNFEFTDDRNAESKISELIKDFRQFISEDELKNAVFMGRVGAGKPPLARSVRMSVNCLLKK